MHGLVADRSDTGYLVHKVDRNRPREPISGYILAFKSLRVDNSIRDYVYSLQEQHKSLLIQGKVCKREVTM